MLVFTASTKNRANAARSVYSLYLENWMNCPAPRGSPPLPQAAWAWRGAGRAVSGCGGIQTVSQQHRGRHRTPWRYDHFVQGESSEASGPRPPGTANAHENMSVCAVN